MAKKWKLKKKRYPINGKKKLSTKKKSEVVVFPV